MSYLKVARAAEVTEGRLMSVSTRFGRIALTRIGDEVLAFQDACTHDDAPLDGGELEGEVIECPRHGARFNMRTGKCLRMPATEDIETYEVRLNGEDVEVKLD